MNIMENVKNLAEKRTALEELEKEVKKQMREIYKSVFQAVADETGAEFDADKAVLHTFSGVFRIGNAYVTDVKPSILYYNVKKNGEESVRWNEQIFLGGGSKKEQFMSWSNKTGSNDINDVVQYLIDKYF